MRSPTVWFLIGILVGAICPLTLPITSKWAWQFWRRLEKFTTFQWLVLISLAVLIGSVWAVYLHWHP